MRAGKGFKVEIDPTKIMERYKVAAREFGKAINTTVYAKAIKEFVPEDTRALAKSLREKVIVKDDGMLICQFSSALHYAKKQHDFNLRHTAEPKGTSFAVYGTSSMPERTTKARDQHKAKYASGYELLKDSAPQYASKFFEKPLMYVQQNLDHFAQSFYKAFNRK